MSSDGGARDALLGSLHVAEGGGTVRIQNHLEAGVDDVWAALSDRDRLAIWLGEVEGDFRVGGTFHARFFASGWEGTGRVAVCEPRRRLMVLTRDADEPDAPADHVIDVTLATDGNRTTVVWGERPVPVELLAPYGAGIQVHMEDLAAHLAGRERCDATARFDELLPAYQALAADGD